MKGLQGKDFKQIDVRNGTIDATFITASGGGTNKSIPTLPWTKIISYAPTVTGTTITVGGGGSVPGQTLNVKVFAGGSLVSETPATADRGGIIVAGSPSYIF